MIMDEYMEVIKPNDIRDNPGIHADNNTGSCSQITVLMPKSRSTRNW